VKALAGELGADIVSVDKILEIECDVLSPCALGGGITESLLARLRTKVIAGAANNQLASPSVGKQLFDRGIFYAPDYAINAGGLINVAGEYKGYDEKVAREKTMLIYDTIASLIDRSRAEKLPPEVIADKIVDEMLSAS